MRVGKKMKKRITRKRRKCLEKCLEFSVNLFLLIQLPTTFFCHFLLSAGADIKEMTARSFAGLVTGKFRSNFAALHSTKPLIAAVNGYAVSVQMSKLNELIVQQSISDAHHTVNMMSSEVLRFFISVI